MTGSSVNVLVTGTSGTGKSSIAQSLKSLGHVSYDGDYDLGIAFWQNKLTGLAEEMPLQPPNDWGATHNWMWNIDVLKASLEDQKAENVFICGSASNQAEAYSLFDVFIQLRVTNDTLRNRIINRTNNHFGKQPKELAWILAHNMHTDTAMPSEKTIFIDTDQPLQNIVREIISQVSR